jgi:hypothetical protein
LDKIRRKKLKYKTIKILKKNKKMELKGEKKLKKMITKRGVKKNLK